MKTYLGSLFTAMFHHLNFVTEHFFTVTIWAILAGIGVSLVDFIEVYVFSDFKYLIYLAIMMAMDAYSGIARQNFLHAKDPVAYPAPTMKAFTHKTFSKLMYYLCMLSSLHGLAHFRIKGIEVTLFHAFEYAALISIMATEFWSIQENYADQDKKTLFQLGWDKLKDFIPSKKPINGN